MRELSRAMTTGDTKRLVGLTFDDGYEDFLSTALPILEAVGFSATVFVVAGFYNILWGLWSAADPQWLFRFTGMPLSNQPAPVCVPGNDGGPLRDPLFRDCAGP